MSKKRFLGAILISLFLAVFAAAPAFSDDSDKSVITIDSAEKTEYKKDPVNGGDCIILTGGVQISVAHGSTKTTITADMVNYNRKTDMLYAEGSVSLTQTGSSAGGESVTANSLLFNTTSLEGIFDNGRIVQTQSDALNLPSGSKLNVASSIFGRDSSNTIAFKTGELTFCDDEDPHWKIKATRIWLLPGGEFAFFNAFLYVGHVPLLYLPAFYYPKDELIFNPAFGYRQREGYFINTTTYLYGRKPQDAVSTADLHSGSDDDDDETLNFFSLINTGSLKEQRREGLVLHNLDEDFTGSTTNYLKVMGDYYGNLGAMAGIDGVYKPSGYITDIEGSLKLGFSNTIFYDSSTGAYTPYASSGETYQDSANFMGLEFPFRFMGNLKFVLSKPFSLTLSMPFYSDPYMNWDFNTRAETMDWIDFLMSGTDSDDDDVTEVSSFTWQLSGSYTPKLSSTIFGSWLKTLSLSSFSSSIVFTSLTNSSISSTDDLDDYSPERKFYYPSQITPFKGTLKIAGTLFEYPSTTKKKSTKASLSMALMSPADLKTEDAADTAEDSAGAEPDISEDAEEMSADEEAARAEATAEDGEAEAEKAEAKDAPRGDGEPLAEGAETTDVVFGESALPQIAVTIPSAQTLSSLSYKLSYTITPTFTSQFTYSSSNLSEPEDFDWQDDLQSTYYQLKVPTVLSSALGWRGSFVTLTDTFTFSPVYQEHPYLNDDFYTTTQINSLKKTDYNARKMDLTDVNALSFKPFYYTEHFSATALTWNTTIKMIRTEYVSDDVDNPEWDYLLPELWSSDCVTTHNLNLVLAASEFDGKTTQQLSLTSTLPPQVDAYAGTLTFTFPYVTLTGGTGVKQTSSTDSTWVKQDITESLSVSLFSSKLKFTQSFTYDWESWESEAFKLSLSGYGLSFAYTASYTTGYTFDDDTYNADGTVATYGNGWVASSEKKFQPYSMSLSYASGTKTWYHWAKRITVSPSVSTGVVYDFLRPTNSYFTFVPALTFKINDFFNVTFSSESKNSVIYRYFQNYMNTDYTIGGETNILTDLMNSFSFTDESKRKSSGFKLKSLKVTVTHDLDDWDLAASFSVKPRLTTDSLGVSYYDFSPYFTISVAWRPMSGMKTEIVDEYGDWELNP
mgnify:CR=1 FL=1